MTEEKSVMVAVRILHDLTVGNGLDTSAASELAKAASGVRTISGTLVREGPPTWAPATRWIVEAAIAATGEVDRLTRAAGPKAALDASVPVAPWKR